MVSLSVYSAEIALEVNIRQDEIHEIPTGGGGRLNEAEKVSHAGEPIDYVNQFFYL